MDYGLGVYSAAEMMELDFIPVCNEEYDFVLPIEYLEMYEIKSLIDIIKSKEFLNKLDILGSYDYSDYKKIIYS